MVKRGPQPGAIGPCSRGKILEDLHAPCRRSVELQRRILVDRADACVADICHGRCSFSCPEIILSDFSLKVQGFRTFRR